MRKELWVILSKINFLLIQCEGFTIDKLPSKDYLLDILFTLEPENTIFTGIQTHEKLIPIPTEFLERFNFVDPMLLDSNKKNKIFKKNSEERIELLKSNFIRRRMKKLRRKNFIASNLAKIDAEINQM